MLVNRKTPVFSPFSRFRRLFPGKRWCMEAILTHHPSRGGGRATHQGAGLMAAAIGRNVARSPCVPARVILSHPFPTMILPRLALAGFAFALVSQPLHAAKNAPLPPVLAKQGKVVIEENFSAALAT